ncbi:SIS domain-containing protein [Granulicella cerasi]|uniref:Glutamine--fructose-6-phosphate aminotransferase [isomerizing] n=1 Tax=Granulicella cerasi TaxID=741063 RepID=A0ABW1Z7J6_9BACT|nr:SIS domain-containing protein [Granulicella cerasi]
MDTLDQPLTFPHWMLQEIHQQPEALRLTLTHYVENGKFREETNAAAREWLGNPSREILIAASGSSRHAGMVAELLFEEFSDIAVDVEYASEYSLRGDRGIKDAAVLVISQSGETADTLAALRRAQRAGQRTMAVTNVPTSSMAKEATVSYPTLAGRERAVPATKSFTCQLLVLQLLALLAAEARGTMTPEEITAQLRQLEALPAIIEQNLAGWQKTAEKIATANKPYANFLFLGRGLHYPIAREGALKLKESSYLHAEGYPSGELKHGPNALVSDQTPLAMIATVDRNAPDSVERYEKTIQLMKDMKAQGAKIVCTANAGDEEAASLSAQTFFVPALSEAVLPFAEVIAYQFFSYFMAIQADINVDQPRNLVKAVVVE